MAPRTGCTAVGLAMEQNWGAERLPPDSVLGSDGSIQLPWKHNTVAQLLNARLITEEELSTWTVFTTVRNPFDSLVSEYVKQVRTYQPLLDDPASWVNRKPAYRESVVASVNLTFPEWVRRLDRQRGSRYRRVRARLSTFVAKDPRPRHMYGRFLERADVVLRFESLQSDLDNMLADLQIDSIIIPVINQTAHRESREYREFYDDATREYVAAMFAPDLKRFGYTF